MSAQPIATSWPGPLQPPTINTVRYGSQKGTVVFSGGSAANSLVDVFNQIPERYGGVLSYVIPISDNGGSSSELIRVFGGPGQFHVLPCKFIEAHHHNRNWRLA